jgi:hypothetical protein
MGAMGGLLGRAGELRRLELVLDRGQSRCVDSFILEHRHAPSECRVAFAAWRGFDSPLREQPVAASCAGGGHRLIWTVQAESRVTALAQLPPWVAERTDVEQVSEVGLP